MKENNMQEIWKDIPGYDTYEVSNLGNVKGKNGFLKPILNNSYLMVALYSKGKRKYFLIHRLVWLTFKGPIPEGLQINHKDEVKANNALLNLELVTPSQNSNYGTRNKRISEKNYKRIQMIDKNNNTLKTFNSLTEASHFFNKTYCGNISRCLHGYRKYAYGYKWKFEA